MIRLYSRSNNLHQRRSEVRAKAVSKLIQDQSHLLMKENNHHLQVLKLIIDRTTISRSHQRQQSDKTKAFEIINSKQNSNCNGNNYASKMYHKAVLITPRHSIRISNLFQLSSCFRIYVIGGRDLAFKSHNDVWKYDIQYQLWAKISFDYKSSPGSLSNHSAVLLQDSIYVYGGLFQNNSQNKNVYQFDINKKSWRLADVKNKSQAPTARDQHTAVADTSSSFVVFGGFTDNKKTNQLWRYSIQTNQWTDLNQASQTLPAERSGHIMVKYKSFLYTYGGCDDNGARLNDLWRFSLAGVRKWEMITIAKGDFPISRSGHSAVILKKDKLLIFGGMHGVLHENNELYQLDLEMLKWQKLCAQKLCTTPTKYMPKLQPMINQIRALAVMSNTQASPRSNSILSPKNPIVRPHTNQLVSQSSKSLINQKAIASKQRKKTKSKDKRLQTTTIRLNSPTIQIRSPVTRPFTSTSTAKSSPTKRYTSLKLSSRVQSKKARQNLGITGNISQSPQKEKSPIFKSPGYHKHEQLLDRSRTHQLQSFNNSKSQMLSTYGNFNHSKHSIKKRANALAKILTGTDLNVPGFNLNQPTMEVMRTSYLFKNVNPNKLDNLKKKKYLLDKSIAFVNDQSISKQKNAIELSCRRPPARQGHTVTAISESQMLIFGGDRNRMSFNDMYIFSIDGWKQEDDNYDEYNVADNDGGSGGNYAGRHIKIENEDQLQL